MGVPELLQSIRSGDQEARGDLVRAAYDDLLKLAARWMSDERETHTLTATALANEVAIKLLNDENIPSESRGKFFAYASKAMRHLLIDHARTRGRQKRGGDRKKLSFDEAIVACDERRDEFLAVNHAVEALAAERPRTAKIVEMRYFAGMSVQEIASALRISLATVKRDWVVAKAWLRRELCRGQGKLL